MQHSRNEGVPLRLAEDTDAGSNGHPFPSISGGAFYVYFMSAAFWMGPFFTAFYRYGENRKAVDNERIARSCAGFEGMPISAFYALQNQCTGDELVGGFDSHALPP